MTVSIIIAVKACCENLKECVSKCLELEFKDYEIIILPDAYFKAQGVFSSPKVRLIPTENVTPPKKRDIGVKNAQGDIIAFLDDDTYPTKEWLAEAVNIFKEDKQVGCVCGPAITAKDDSLRQKSSGLVYSSVFISGNYVFRYIPKKRKEVLDFPSCNLLIKKDLFNYIGGFDKPFWPGEDTFLCLKVLNSGKKIIYDPKVLIFHHRRSLFKGHLRQIKNYAYHRGYFAKKYPETSLRFEYFLPSLLVFGLIAGGILGLFFTVAKTVYLAILAVYLGLIIFNGFGLSFKEPESLKPKILLSFFTILGIILTHLVYGLYFVKGLFAGKMPEE